MPRLAVSKEVAAKRDAHLAKVRRPGPGRPPGPSARVKFVKATTDEVIRKGVLPIEVMLHNMRWYHQKAEDLLLTILEAQKKKQLSEDHIIALAKVYDFRSHAQRCAVDAAPFIHSRLSSVTVTGEVTQRHELPAGLELAKAMELYRESLKGRAPAQMKTIEHQAPAAKDQE